MRLSTNTIYALGTQSILDQQSRVSGLAQTLSTGQRINRPSDDPRGSAELLGLQQSQKINAQYAATRASAEQDLSIQENQLGQVTDALDLAKQSLVRAANGTLGDADRASLANQLEGVYERMRSAANAQDGSGRYLFAGTATDTKPFAGEPGALSYRGDFVERVLQVDGARRMSVSTPGTDILARTSAGAKYVASADGGNQGTSTYRSIDVVDRSAADFGQTFSLTFSTDADGATRYRVTNDSDETVVEGDYQAGRSIALGNGLATTFQGEPADGDAYTFARGRAEDSNILDALADTVAALREPAGSPSAQAALTNTVNRANRQVDNALDNVLSVRSSIGTQLAELDDLDRLGRTQSVADAGNISDLRDADLVSTISDFSLAQVALQAARQTFSSVSRMSIFNQG